MDLIRERNDRNGKEACGRRRLGEVGGTGGDRWLLAAMETPPHGDLVLRRTPPLGDTGTGARGLSPSLLTTAREFAMTSK